MFIVERVTMTKNKAQTNLKKSAHLGQISEQCSYDAIMTYVMRSSNVKRHTFCSITKKRISRDTRKTKLKIQFKFGLVIIVLPSEQVNQAVYSICIYIYIYIYIYT